MKRIFKHFILVLLILMTAGATACGGGGDEALGRPAVAIADAYFADSFTIEGISHVQAADSINNKIYFSSDALYYIEIEPDLAAPGELGKTRIPYELNAGEWIINISVNDDLSIDIIVLGEQGGSTDVTVRRVGPDGTGISRINISEDLSEDEYIYPNSLAVDDTGRIYLTNAGNIYIWDKEGRLLNKIFVSGGIVSISRDRALEKIYAAWLGSDGNAGLAEVNPDSAAFRQVYNVSELNAYLGISPGLSGDLLLVSDKSVYAYNTDARSYDEVFNWLSLGTTAEMMGTLLPLSDGRIGWLYNDAEVGRANLKLIRPRREDDPVPDVDTLTVGALSLFLWDNMIRNSIVEFNKNHPWIQLELKEYNGDFSEAMRQLNMDIISGKGPDIMILPPRFSMGLYARKGVLADLYPFIDADSRMERADFLEHIIGAYETDGKLLGIPLGFDIRTVVAAQSKLPDITGWNLDEMISYADDFIPESTVFTDHSKSGVLHLCLFANGDALVDWTGEDSAFQRDLFIKMLHFADRFTPDELYTYDGNYPVRIQDDEQIQLFPINIGSYIDMQTMQLMFGEPVTFPGYPSERGNGNLITSSTILAINENCHDKDAAWAFIRSMLTKEFQSNSDNYIGFPILKSAHETKIKEATEPRIVEIGGVLKEIPHAWVTIGDINHEAGPVTDKDAERIKDLISEVEKIRVFDDQIIDIIMEEAPTFFSGGKPAEEVADVIENRIGIFVNEMK